MRVHEVNASTAIDGQESSCAKIEIRRRRVRREGIGGGRGTERVRKIGRLTILIKSGKVQTHTGKERRLAVELQIVFGFEDIVEHSESAADASLAIAARVPRETRAWRPVAPGRKIRTHGRAGISGKYHSGRGAGKDRGLEAGNDREGAAFGVFFRGVV